MCLLFRSNLQLFTGIKPDYWLCYLKGRPSSAENQQGLTLLFHVISGKNVEILTSLKEGTSYYFENILFLCQVVYNFKDSPLAQF